MSPSYPLSSEDASGGLAIAFPLQTSWRMSPALRRCCSSSVMMVVVTEQHIFPSTLASLLSIMRTTLLILRDIVRLRSRYGKTAQRARLRRSLIHRTLRWRTSRIAFTHMRIFKRSPYKRRHPPFFSPLSLLHTHTNTRQP